MKTIQQHWEETKAAMDIGPDEVRKIFEMAKPFFFIGFAAGSAATLGKSPEAIQGLLEEYTEFGKGLGGAK